MLTQRIISSVFLLLFLLGAIFSGYPYFNLFLGVLVTAMAWEWDTFVNKKITPISLVYTFIAVFCLILPLNMELKLRVPLVMIVIGAIGAYIWAKKMNYNHPKLLAFGMFYIGLPALALNVISTANSPVGIVWIFAIAWACDTGGYIFGCSIKGPKLCPKVSPNKTWAGFIGGLVLACLFSYVYTTALGVQWYGVYALTIALGIIAQIGDLLESSIKRYVGVKDTSNLIPGHGGVFDRFDATILIVIVYAILVVASDMGLIKMMIF